MIGIHRLRNASFRVVDTRGKQTEHVTATILHEEPLTMGGFNVFFC